MDKKLLEDQDNTFDRVLDRLKLEQIDTYLFRYKGKNAGLLRIFGGQVIAQSFIAATIQLQMTLICTLCMRIS